MRSLTLIRSNTRLACLDMRRAGTSQTLLAAAVLLVLFLFYAHPALAGTLDNINNLYKPFKSSWHTQIKAYAERLFWLLVSVDMAWHGILIVLDKADEFKSITVSLIKKVFSIGFFYGLLKFSDTWVPAIIDSLSQIGTTVGGSSATPDGILVDGMETAMTIYGTMKDLGVMESISVGLAIVPCAILIFFCFLIVAGQLLITLVESYLVIGAGTIMLGLGGSRWTTEFTSKYLQYAFGVGVKLMMIYLIVGVGKGIGSGITIDQDNLIESCLTALGSAFIYAFLSLKVGSIASGMLTGASALSGNDAFGTAMGVAAGGAAALGGAMAAGGAAVGAGASGFGAARAVGAGFQVAQESGLRGAAAGAAAFGHAGAAMAREIVNSFGGGVKESLGAKVDQTSGARAAQQLLGSLGGGMVPVDPTAGAAGGSDATGPIAEAGASTGAPNSGGSPAAQASSASAAPSSSTGSTFTPSSAGMGSSSAKSSPTGDASSAAVAPSSSQSNSASNGTTERPFHQRMEDRFQSAKGFMPDDGGTGSVNIPMNHVE
ncbi:P-type conjugative transfer protein TrbL [Chromobacterium piscinae]|uniref:P-type conjugative transfer protein TrbL n=1 Tax=Chromobacterium piscinae TaxID=686831 RepID=UPI001E586A5F|nr:P-type conjugative transfer protein TrbL [Chromobacterium piscinae]MCD5327930.1 P-type conjugative transfer protein TrbL [Chromobacterium piscinae]